MPEPNPDAAPAASPRPPHPLRLACVFESAIGHKTVQANLARQMERWPDVCPTWHLLPYEPQGGWPPRFLNWTLRSGLLARAALRGSRPEALLFQTHLPALLCPDYLRRAPALLSVDATPILNAQLGIYVGGTQRAAASRSLVTRWTAAIFRRAYRVVAWSDWVRQSLVSDYRVPADRIELLALGTDTIDDATIAATLGVILKHQSDQQRAAGELRLN